MLIAKAHLKVQTTFMVPGYLVYKGVRDPLNEVVMEMCGVVLLPYRQRLFYKVLTTNTTYESTGIALQVGG